MGEYKDLDFVIMIVGLCHQDRESDFVMMSSRILISADISFTFFILLSWIEYNQSNY